MLIINASVCPVTALPFFSVCSLMIAQFEHSQTWKINQSPAAADLGGWIPSLGAFRLWRRQEQLLQSRGHLDSGHLPLQRVRPASEAQTPRLPIQLIPEMRTKYINLMNTCIGSTCVKQMHGEDESHQGFIRVIVVSWLSDIRFHRRQMGQVVSRHVTAVVQRDRRLEGRRAVGAAGATDAALRPGPHQLAARRGHLPAQDRLLDLRRKPAQPYPLRRWPGEAPRRSA